ncbi:PEP-CTERM sorting domain-containing protein [Methylobacter sp.]|uniref:PEP-CTERM sorting domain-containing protein n=1 Tax=Methylobacter sp. TaxID=2051955 RepID=UPI00120ECD84|nr:PEP-CTERM sorting domain-containing protein [Methylobacter sp.]TAK61890.1 MAG: PEP-CTERM sorting domain-containing protein [Methylobacter sp.]
MTTINKYISSIILTLSFSSAHATTIYEQNYDPTIFGAYYADQGQHLYDDFTITTNASVNSLTFWGTYWIDGIAPNPANFDITIGDSPSNIDNIFSATATPTITDTGFDHNGQPGANILEFNITFNTVIQLAANTQYFLGIYSNDNNPTNRFEWIRSNQTGTLYSNGNPSELGNTSFRLSSTSTNVPEPTTTVLMGLGFAGLGYARRRKAQA